MGKKVFEVVYGKGRGVRRVLVNSKRAANKMTGDLVKSGLFKKSEFKIKPISVKSGNHIGKVVRGIKRRVKRKKK